MTRFEMAGRCLLLSLTIVMPFWGQPFDSGSTGTDGKLDYTGRSGTVVFDPASIPGHPVGSNVFNFTTITIPANLTVKFSQTILHGPVIWLAQGAVSIGAGAILDLSGSAGGPGFPISLRSLATPGPGGYPGGVGGGGVNTPGSGLGPLGGASCSGGAVTGGKYGGNKFAIPLVGGSGGGGCNTGGGAGGGAILISSSTSIVNNGLISVTGGNAACGDSGSGSGGAVRLVAPNVLAGTIAAYGGSDGCANVTFGGPGIIRLESFNSPGGSFPAGLSPTYGSPFRTFVTASIPPIVKVVSVNGTAVASPATGSFMVPDVAINSNAQVTVQIQASQVPLNTIVNLVFFSDNGPDMTVNSTPLAGTLAASTATATYTFPAGYTRGFVSATF